MGSVLPVVSYRIAWLVVSVHMHEQHPAAQTPASGALVWVFAHASQWCRSARPAGAGGKEGVVAGIAGRNSLLQLWKQHLTACVRPSPLLSEPRF